MVFAVRCRLSNCCPLCNGQWPGCFLSVLEMSGLISLILMQIRAERFAYWYLRLNGFLTIPNFVVHPDVGRNQETDVDLIGVRFPYRAENLVRQMDDDTRFAAFGEKILVALVEVKLGQMRLNGPWTNPQRNNMLRVLRAVGPLPLTESKSAAQSLYKNGLYRSQLYHVSLFCIGEQVNSDLQKSHPDVPQVTWTEIKHFVHSRFRAYRNEKRSHGQWDDDGQNLWQTADRLRDLEAFVDAVEVVG
jgi:hypothetical protein